MIDTDNCGRIFLFHDSRLRASPCRADSPDTGAFCLEENSAAWQNECSGVVSIVTPSGRRVAPGHVALGHLRPGSTGHARLCVRGHGDRHPLHGARRRTGWHRARSSRRETFWYTAPDDQLDQIGGMEPREAHGFEDLPAVMNELGLQSWFASIGSRAAADGVPMEGFPEAPALNLRAGGGPLESVDVQDAVLASTDWERWWFELFPDGDRQLVALIGTNAPRDLAVLGCRPDRGRDAPQAGRRRQSMRPTILAERDEARARPGRDPDRRPGESSGWRWPMSWPRGRPRRAPASTRRSSRRTNP